MNNLLKIPVLLLLYVSCAFCQISTDTVFTVKGVPVSFNIDAEGMVLSHITEYKYPFYHASALLSTVITTNIGKNVRVPVRIVAEVWNFSEKYGDERNLFTWAKPSIQARINNILMLDSVVFNVGDLWRQKQGQGLTLDYFEAQGGEATFYKNKFFLSARDLGYGYTGFDDIATLSIGYDSVIAIRHLLNYFEGSHRPSSNISISSIDSYVKINKYFHLYEEAAVNTDNFAKAACIGVVINFQKDKSFVNARLECRYYDKDFFFKERPRRLPYFYSITALDKPINQYYAYMLRNKKSITFGGRITGKLFLKREFFIDADIEPLAGDINMFGYEATIGFEPEANVLLRAGIMNKFFNVEDRYSYYNSPELYDPEKYDMFILDKKPFLFAKASFKL